MTLAAHPSRSRSRTRLLGWLALLSFAVLLANVVISGARKEPSNKIVALNFVDHLRPLINDANAQSAELNRIRDGFSRDAGQSKPTEDAKSLQKRLNKLHDDVTATANSALAVEAPKEVREIASLGWASFSLRSKAMDSIASSLSAVLANKESEAQSDLQNVNGELATSDSVYMQFKNQMNSAGFKADLPDSQWLSDQNFWKDDDASFLVAAWRADLSGAVVHNMSIVSVLTDPASVRTGDDKSPIQILPLQHNMNVTVVVGNLGNVKEENVPIKVTILAADGSSDSKNDVVTLEPGAKTTLEFKNIRVVPGGNSSVAVQLTPVDGESDTGDNNYSLVFTMDATAQTTLTTHLQTSSTT